MDMVKLPLFDYFPDGPCVAGAVGELMPADGGLPAPVWGVWGISAGRSGTCFAVGAGAGRVLVLTRVMWLSNGFYN